MCASIHNDIVFKKKGPGPTFPFDPQRSSHLLRVPNVPIFILFLFSF